MIRSVIYWCAAILPSLPFVIIYLAYRRTLLGKRLTVQQVMGRQNVIQSYLSAFGKADADNGKPLTPGDVVRTLFNLYYHWGSYAFGITLNVVITIIMSAAILTKAKVPLGLPPALEALAQAMLPAVAFGFAGAYIWDLYDLLNRYRGVDITPASFQFSWLRLLAGSIVGPLGSLAVAEGVKNIAAFGLGVLPLQTIFQFFADYASKKLSITANESPVEASTLHKLQGMTRNQIDRLAEEGIDSTATLAYSDPMKMFLKTDIEWVVIIDIIDQALLFNYVGDKLSLLRPVGIRGSIETAVIYERLISNKAQEVEEAEALVKIVAGKLELSGPEALNLIRTVWEDDQVDLLWRVFGDTF
ncbi:MAG TPA: hypothetical protein VNW97_10335 [Candidatus Saccharimonadales bacterium]|jgi:hypothetical protein|nr:hypothetical protein [Candidatus Saccharimonadales bacterium]